MSPEFERLLALFQHVQQVPSDERTALSDTVREQVRALKADNAALLRGLRRARAEMAVLRDTDNPKSRRAGAERAVAGMDAVLLADHPGAAQLAEMEALTKADIWEKATSLARDAALEEAEQACAVEAKTWGNAKPVIAANRCADRIRALKSEPGKRFVDAEEVCRIATAYASDLRDCGDVEGPSALEHFVEKVRALTLEKAP